MTIYPTSVPLSPETAAYVPVIQIERRGRYDPGFFGRMIAAMRRCRPHVVHTHLHNGKYWGRLAALAARVPVVVFTEHNPCGEQRILPELLVDVVVNRLTDGIATFAEQQRLLLAANEHVNPDRVVVIENGIALPPAPSAALRARAREQLGVRPDEFAVLVVARLIARKNQRLAIEALRHVSSEMRARLRLFIVGGGEDEAMLHEAAAAGGAADCITFTGNREDAVELLQGADLFYMPSLAEGMPLAMLEAMSVGVPVLTTPWTGVRELLRNGTFGTILEDWDPQSSAQAIETAMQTPDALAVRARIAMEHVRVNYDVSRSARAHEAWYGRLALARGIAMPDSKRYQSPARS